MQLDAQHILKTIKDPRAAVAAIEKYEAEERLIDFIEPMWPVLEPGRPFVRGWVIEAICEGLEAVTRGDLDGRGLLINVPPGMMKSMTVNVFWPAWEWGPKNMAWLRYLSLSYSEGVTIRDNRKCRTLMGSEEYQQHWGDRFSFMGDQNEKMKFENDKRGYKQAASMLGQVMGERADRILIDDPNNTKASDSEAKLDQVLQVFTEVIPTRVNDPKKTVTIVIMQRTNERDVSGHILAHALDYYHLMIPMEFEPDRKCVVAVGDWLFEDPRTQEGELCFPERFDRRAVDKLKKELSTEGGNYAVSGQLQQRPSPRGGGMFKKDDITILPELPPGVVIVKEVRGWDLAGSKKKKSPFTAGVRMVRLSDRRIIVMNVKRKKGSTGEIEDLLFNTAEADGLQCIQSIPQDPGQAGLAQKRSLAGKLGGFQVHFSPESGDKAVRASPLANQSEGGNLYLLKGSWNDSFLKELCDFPVGAFKDQVDAASRAYALLMPRRQDTDELAGGELIDAETGYERGTYNE